MAQLHIDRYFEVDRERLWAIFSDFGANLGQSIEDPYHRAIRIN